MMSRKDYENAAAVVRKAAIAGLNSGDIAAAFVEFFQDDNSRFDAQRFVAACEPKVMRGQPPRALVTIEM